MSVLPYAPTGRKAAGTHQKRNDGRQRRSLHPLRVIGDLAPDPGKPDDEVEEQGDRDGRQEGRQLDGPAVSVEGTRGNDRVSSGRSTSLFCRVPNTCEASRRDLQRRCCPRPSRCVWVGWTFKLRSPFLRASCPALPTPPACLESREKTHAPMPAPWKPSSRRLGTPSWLAASAPRTMYLRWKHGSRGGGGSKIGWGRARRWSVKRGEHAQRPATNGRTDFTFLRKVTR